MRAVTAPGRMAWAGIGLATAAALSVLGIRLLVVQPGTAWHVRPQSAVTVTVTVPDPVTGLTVQSYGAPVRVTAGRVGRVRVVERIGYDKRAGPPPVTESVSAGHLTLAAPVCASSDCTVAYSVTVPARVAVTVASGGGPVTVSGTAGADVNSEGGPVSAAHIHGPLNVASGGGPVLVNGLAGLLHVGSEGGDVTARGVDTTTATVDTGGGLAWIAFSAAPDTVRVSADGGSATLMVPGGPYALSAETDGGAEQFGVATDPKARMSIMVDTGGGPMLIRPAPSGVRR